MAASRFAATIVVPHLGGIATPLPPPRSLRNASLAALSTSSAERTPWTKNPSSVENPLSFRPGVLSIITTMVACSRAWLRLRILFPNIFLSCRGYTNKPPTACKEYRIGSRNRKSTKINATNRINRNVTLHHLRTENYTHFLLYRRLPPGTLIPSPSPAER